MDIDIAGALADATTTEATGRCGLVKILDTIPEDAAGRADLLDAIDSPDWSAPMLGKVLSKLGLGCSLTTIRMHRSGTCPCYIRA